MSAIEGKKEERTREEQAHQEAKSQVVDYHVHWRVDHAVRARATPSQLPVVQTALQLVACTQSQ